LRSCALGTPIWFYAFTLWEHLPAVCLLTWGLVFLLRSQVGEGGRGATALAALLCGAAVWMRDDALLFALAMTAVPIVVSGRAAPGAKVRRRGGWQVEGRGAAAPLSIRADPSAAGAAQWIILGTPFGIHATAHGPPIRKSDGMSSSGGSSATSSSTATESTVSSAGFRTSCSCSSIRSGEPLRTPQARWPGPRWARSLRRAFGAIADLVSAVGEQAVRHLPFHPVVPAGGGRAASGPSAARGRFTTADQAPPRWLVAITISRSTSRRRRPFTR
jgi:hypothetical protein